MKGIYTLRHLVLASNQRSRVPTNVRCDLVSWFPFSLSFLEFFFSHLNPAVERCTTRAAHRSENHLCSGGMTFFGLILLRSRLVLLHRASFSYCLVRPDLGSPLLGSMLSLLNTWFAHAIFPPLSKCP